MLSLPLKVSLPFYTKLAMVLVSLISLGYICVLGKEILSPLLYSFLFAILLMPVASRIERKLKLPRSAAAGISVILLLLFIATIIFFVGSQISNLAHDWPSFQQEFSVTIDNF